MPSELLDRIPLVWHGEEIILDARRAAFFPLHKTLLLSDVHLGKASHFRKNGIAIPENIHFDDLARLQSLIDDYLPKQIVFLGDLFHSDWNYSWELFQLWLAGFKGIQFHIVLGNHDILQQKHYLQAGLIIHPDKWMLGNISLFHEPQKDYGGASIFGHIHPAVRIPLKGRQKINTPCFFMNQNELILPSFGNFTGKSLLENRKEGRYFAILNQKLLEVTSLVFSVK